MRRTLPYLSILLLIVSGGCFSGDDKEPDRQPDTGLKVVVVGLDGAHLGLLSPLIEAGRLPNLRAYLEKATLGIMSSPIHEGFTSPALWTSMVTGLEPYEHGISDFVLPDPSTCEDVAAATGHRIAPALWNMVSDAQIRSAIVGLWATWPAEPIRGVIVTDHVTYSRMRMTKDFGFDTSARNVSPSRFEQAISEVVRLPSDVTATDLRRFIPDLSDDEVAEILSGEYTDFIAGAEPLQELKVTLQSDRSYAEIGTLIDAQIDPSLLLVYLEGIDVMEHNFWPYHDPEYPRPLDAPRERFQDLLSRYVELTDELIKPYLEMANEDTVVIVVSDHGFTTVPDPSHPYGRWHDGNAIFFAAGGPIKPQHILDPSSMSIYDVTPTILTLLGLPAGADMKGRVIEEMFDPAFLESHPPTKIESHGRRPLNPGYIAQSEDDDALRDRLAQMGYISARAEKWEDGSIDMDAWAATPSVFGRLAIDCDMTVGRAMFTSDPRQDPRPGRGPIPRCAIYTDDKGDEHPCVVIQIEETRTKTRVGLRLLDGTGVGTTIDRVKLLNEGPDERFK